MNEKNGKICPLLSSVGTEGWEHCMADRCAWYIPPDRPSLNPEGRCAITYLPDLSDIAKAVWAG